MGVQRIGLILPKRMVISISIKSEDIVEPLVLNDQTELSQTMKQMPQNNQNEQDYPV